VWRANSSHFLILLILSAIGLAIGGVLAGTIHDKAQHIWRGQAAHAGFSWNPLDAAVFNLRTSRWYRGFFLRLKTTVLPFFFAGTFGLLGLALLSQLIFAGKEAVASYCVPSVQRVDFDQTGRTPQLSFDPRQVCWASGILLQGERRYRVIINANDDWANDRIPADLYGLDYGSGWSRHFNRTLMLLAVPLRRSIMGRWYALYARVGSEGRDVQLLSDSVRPPLESREQRLHAEFEFKAHQNGELFLFVNDAVPLLLFHDFYDNNKGTATLLVEQLSWDAGPANPEK
jgi:hypothetical protein